MFSAGFRWVLGQQVSHHLCRGTSSVWVLRCLKLLNWAWVSRISCVGPTASTVTLHSHLTHALYLKPGWSSHFPSRMDRESHHGFKDTAMLWQRPSTEIKLSFLCMCVGEITLTFHIFSKCLFACFYFNNSFFGKQQ